MSLKHISRIQTTHDQTGKTVWRLIDNSGQSIEPYDRFSEHLIKRFDHAFTTRKRYSESTSKFIDFLIEWKVFGRPVSNLEIQLAIDDYLQLLRDGPTSTDQRIRNYANAIGMKRGLSEKSFLPVIASLNKFLRFAQALNDEAVASMRSNGVAVDVNDHQILIEAVNGLRTLNHIEKIRVIQNSTLAAVMRICGEITRPRGIKAPSGVEGQIDIEHLDFPLERINDLLDSRTCYRDEALFSLLAAGGLRESEALNLRLSDIDFENRRVYVVDPNHLRFGKQMTSEEKLRFKGRVVSEVFLFEPLKTKFFTALELYLLHEYLPTKEHEYVFQILEPSRRGVPYKNASDATRVTSFKRTVRRAGVPGPSYAPKHVWTPHSLRHAYGVYLLNYLPTPNGLGLRLEEVQYLMGHKDIKTTRGYARQGVDILRAKLLWADEQVSEVGFDLDRFRRLSRACYELLTMVSFGVCDAKTIPVT